jgi:hypothetical protein
VISFYRYLLWAKANPSGRDVEPAVDRLQALTPCVGDGFKRFLEQVPPRFLLAQVFMFSERMDPTEAADRALGCSAVCFTDTFSDDLKHIAAKLELDLIEKHERRFGEEVQLTDDELDQMRKLLKPEYAMVDRVREGRSFRQSLEQPDD